MSREQQTTICRQGRYYLLLLAVVLTWAMLRQENLLMIVAGLLCGPLVLNWRLPKKTLRGIHARRRVLKTIHAGESLQVELQLTNTRKRGASWAIVAHDHIAPEDRSLQPAPLQPAAFVSYLPAGQVRPATYRLRLQQRGRYRVGPVTMTTRFPFGLFQRRVTTTSTDTITVLPRLGRLGKAWATGRLQAAEGPRGGRTATRTPGDFFGVREWQAGDQVRWIHWRSTVRHGELTVRQFEQPCDYDVTVIVDLWQPPRPTPQDVKSVELVVSLAATIVVDLCRRRSGAMLLVVAAEEPACVAGATSTLLMREALEELAVAKAAGEDRLSAAIETAARQSQLSTETFLLSTRAADPLDASQLAALQPKGSRSASGRVQVISVADPLFGELFQLQ